MDKPTPQAIPPTPTTTLSAPKTSIMPVFLSVLLCISLATIGLLFYQNTQLKKQLESLKTASPSPTPGPTAGWETYTNNKYSFTFNFPDNWRVRSYGGSNISVDSADSFVLEGPYKDLETLLGGPKYAIRVEASLSKYRQQPSLSTEEKVIVKQRGEMFVRFTFSSSLLPPEDITKVDVFDQIISTFKFTSSNASKYTCPETEWD